MGEVEARTSPAETLLLPPGTPCDLFVALHELARVGHRMTCLEVGRIRVWKPGKPDLQLDCTTGCPEIAVKEIELSKRLARARLAGLTAGSAPESGEAFVQWFRTIVPSLPGRLLADLACPSCASVPFMNRRKCRSLMRARRIVLHHPFPSLPPGCELVEIDVQENLADPKTFGWLLHLVASGRVCAIVGGLLAELTPYSVIG